MKRDLGMRLGVLAVVVSLTFVVAAGAASVWINEIHYDNSGADAGEFVEIAGDAGDDLSGYKIRLYNGSSGSPYSPIINLSGVIPDQMNGFGTLSFYQSGIQNGSPDGLALVDPSDSVLYFLSYEGAFTATDGPANGMTSTDIGVSEPSSTPVGHSLQLSGTGSGYGDFTWSGPSAGSAGAVNTAQTFVARVFDGGSTLAMLLIATTGLLRVRKRNPSR